MKKYSYGGPAEVTAEPSGGAEALRGFAGRAGTAGRVHLCDRLGVSAVLLLDDRAISEPHNWQGASFHAGAELLEVTAEADGPEGCGAALTAALFDFFDGQASSGEACFPIRHQQLFAGPGRGGKVIVAQVNRKEMLAAVAANPQASMPDLLTLRIDPAESARADNWREVVLRG